VSIEGIAVDKDQTAKIQATAERVLELAEEVEAAGHAALDTAALEAARATLHQWIDGLKGVVVNPALGRVTIIHENGRESTIASSDLPYLMSRPVNAKPSA
jgi:hypothetical protein